MNKNDMVSIIIPIYNSEERLRRTLTSVTEQTYQKIEIICVNDGSTDNSEKICNEYKTRDERIKIINKKNTGVGDSRNVGIDNSNGDYIFFIDSDDQIPKNYIETLVNLQKQYNADLVESGVEVYFSEDNLIYPYMKEEKINIFDNETLVKNYLNFNTNTSVWGKLYTRELIKDIRFPKTNINEDFIFTWEIDKKTAKCVETFGVFYRYYLDNENSLSKKTFSKKNMSMIEYIETVYRECLEKYPNLREYGYNHFKACLLHNLVLYYIYLTGANVSDLYINERNEMLSKMPDVEKLDSYLLLHESQYNIKELKKSILHLTGGR